MEEIFKEKVKKTIDLKRKRRRRARKSIKGLLKKKEN